MKKKLLILGITLLMVLAFCVAPVAACNHNDRNDPHRHHQEDYKPTLVFFYFSKQPTDPNTLHLIKDNQVNDSKMLKVVRQLDRTYDVQYYDLSTHPGSINMARMAYGVTQTPTISVLGPNFPAQASNFYDIAGYHSYKDIVSTIEHNKFQ